MLLEFSVDNFLSIKDRIKISFNSSSEQVDTTFKVQNFNVLKYAGIFGSNASGKSNVLKALAFMKTIVLNQAKVMQSTDLLPHYPFQLNSETENAASTFEIVFFINNIKYRYGFEADTTTVYSEWLYAAATAKEAKLFYRDIDEDLHYINEKKFKEGKGIKVLQNHLFIWKCDQAGGQISRLIFQWFNNLNLIDGNDTNGYTDSALGQMDDEAYAKELTALVKGVADLGIENISLEKEDVNDEVFKKMATKIKPNGSVVIEKVQIVNLQTSHPKFNNKDEKIGITNFDLSKNESLGTKKFFFLAAPILDTLRYGRILLIDEFGASMHPMLTKELLKLFANPKVNKKNAQLLFVTHEISLMTPSFVSRDQVWFTEKNKFGVTSLFSLADIKNVRKHDKNWVEKYLFGIYGGIPYFDFECFYEELNHE